jgi:hypothetical protein
MRIENTFYDGFQDARDIFEHVLVRRAVTYPKPREQSFFEDEEDIIVTSTPLSMSSQASERSSLLSASTRTPEPSDPADEEEDESEEGDVVTCPEQKAELEKAIVPGCQVEVVAERPFDYFETGDRGRVLLVDEEAQNCEVHFGHRESSLRVALRHLSRVEGTWGPVKKTGSRVGTDLVEDVAGGQLSKWASMAFWAPVREASMQGIVREIAEMQHEKYGKIQATLAKEHPFHTYFQKLADVPEQAKISEVDPEEALTLGTLRCCAGKCVGCPKVSRKGRRKGCDFGSLCKFCHCHPVAKSHRRRKVG